MSEVEVLKEEIKKLKQRQLVLEDQVSFYKYKYKLLKISTLNNKNHDETLLEIHVIYEGNSYAFKVPTNFKIISLKRLISDKLKIMIPLIKLSISFNELSNEYTMHDYLIKQGDNLLMESPLKNIVIDGERRQYTHSSNISELKSELQLNKHLTLAGIIISDETSLNQLESGANLKTKNYKVTIYDGDSEIGDYGIDFSVDLLNLDVTPNIPDNIDELLIEPNTNIRLSIAKWKIRLNKWKLNTVEVSNLNCSKQELMRLLKVSSGSDSDIQVYDELEKDFKPIKDDCTLRDLIIYPFQDSETTFRAVQYVSLPYEDIFVKLTHFAGASGLDLRNQIKGFHLTSKKTGKIISEVGKSTWSELNGLKLTARKVDIYDFSNVKVCSVGIDERISKMTLADLLAKIDDFIFDGEWDTLYLMGGRKFSMFIHDAQTFNVQHFFTFQNLQETISSELHVYRKLMITRMSNPSLSFPYGYNSSTTIQMLKDYIKTFVDGKVSGFRMLYCKKSTSQKGFANLQRFFDCELLVNCYLTRENNLIYYEVALQDDEQQDDEQQLEETFAQTYVVEYSKLQKIGMIDGVVKRYKTSVLNNPGME